MGKGSKKGSKEGGHQTNDSEVTLRKTEVLEAALQTVNILIVSVAAVAGLWISKDIFEVVAGKTTVVDFQLWMGVTGAYSVATTTLLAISAAKSNSQRKTIIRLRRGRAKWELEARHEGES